MPIVHFYWARPVKKIKSRSKLETQSPKEDNCKTSIAKTILRGQNQNMSVLHQKERDRMKIS